MIADRIEDLGAAIEDRREVPCNKCGAGCFWSRTMAGRGLLLDFAPDSAGDIVIAASGPDPNRHGTTALWSANYSPVEDPDRTEVRFVPHRRTCTGAR